ncbi:MAG: putative porin [Sphingopyxis sp.]|nr:putative porin [Sphingopyxis sp.]
MRIRSLPLTAAMLACAPVAHAQDSRLDALEHRLAAQDQRIAELEALVTAQSELLRQVTSPATPTRPAPTSTAPHTLAPPLAAVPPPSAAVQVRGLDVGGDMRVRQEWNRVNGRDRSRTAVRARLRATYTVGDSIAVGTQIVTGDPDDPNSTDVALGNFADDFPVALDQAWIRYRSGGLTAYAGKFPQIIQRTDMLWDSDVSPQGVAVTYTAPLGQAKLDARGIWFVIDEAAVARDSDMLGGQLAFAAPVSDQVKVGLTGSYYHYRLGSAAGADAGDFRGNLLASGRYLSDFHLVEGIGSIGWTGSARWPVTLTADFVRNVGAAVPGDTAFNLELAAGRTASPGDVRIAYNFSEVEVDAVLAAFSHDNIDLSTNYRLHGLGLSYVPASKLQVDLLWYHYRPLDRAYAGALPSSDWLDRIRLAFTVTL